MAGHSKWANIKNRKGAQDARRAKIFNKFSREITLAAQRGGAEPESNPTLRLAVAKAKAQSMPKKNIEAAIAKGAGSKDAAAYQEQVFSGNVHGVSFLIHTLSDNPQRVTAQLQFYFNRAEGALGGPSAVAHIFDRTGILALPKDGLTADEVMLAALDAGASDFEEGEDSYFIYTRPSDFAAVKDRLEKEAHWPSFTTAAVSYLPNIEVRLPKAKAEKLLEFIDRLEDDDDVQDVYHNLDIASLD